MFEASLREHLALFERLAALAPIVDSIGIRLAGAVGGGAKILICGNGGSAADAQHFAAELIGRFELERAAWPCIALTTDSSILTALGNDYGFDTVFARQVEGLGRAGDILIGLSTSGRSPNVRRAVEAARALGVTTIGLLGRDGGDLAPGVDQAVVVPGQVTARIQEAHILILHVWAKLIEHRLSDPAH